MTSTLLMERCVTYILVPIASSILFVLPFLFSTIFFLLLRIFIHEFQAVVWTVFSSCMLSLLHGKRHSGTELCLCLLHMSAPSSYTVCLGDPLACQSARKLCCFFFQKYDYSNPLRSFPILYSFLQELWVEAVSLDLPRKHGFPG